MSALKPKLSIFEHYLKIIFTILKNNINLCMILKQIVWETSKLAFKFQ